MSNALALLKDNDPAHLGFPPQLPIEIALREEPVKDICEAYGIDRAKWSEIRTNPMFVNALSAAAEMLQREGMTFRTKARLQAEELLKTSWLLIHSSNDQVPPAVKADLIKHTIKFAGLDASIDQKNAGGGGGGFGNALQININLG
jgi:hypothetical protein